MYIIYIYTYRCPFNPSFRPSLGLKDLAHSLSRLRFQLNKVDDASCVPGQPAPGSPVESRGISKKSYQHGSLNVPIEHHPTIRYMVYNGYYKVMSNIPKMGQLPTPDHTYEKCANW